MIYITLDCIDDDFEGNALQNVMEIMMSDVCFDISSRIT